MANEYNDEFQDGLAKLVTQAIKNGLKKEDIAEILILTAQDFCK